jgi:Signal transduction histidine kinase
VHSPVNILLVDDDSRNLEVLEGILRSDELRLVRATSADEALLALLHEDFAVIVLDVQMPDVNGIELAHLIKQREKTQHIPIIFLTAFYEDEQRMLESYNVGAVDYLTKPANPQVLRSKVAVFVELFRKTSELRHSNSALEQEIRQRKLAEQALRESHDALEARVEARTAALRLAHAEAERAGRAKDDFLAALSHELRTPLNPVLLIASEAANNPAFSAEARAHFSTIRKNVELEARLIDDLLDLTRIMRGKLTLSLRPRDVHAILRDALANVQSDIEQKELTSVLNLAPGLHHVRADDVRLQQVFWNILKNAVKFTNAPGAIHISSEISPEKNTIAIAIRDTGIGLTREEMSRVFDAFSQGNHAVGGHSHRFGGLGLGLTISRSLVEHHEGKICVRSDGPGCGATFIVELPLASAHADDKGESFPPAEDTTPPMMSTSAIHHVLLVEDHEPTRRTLETLLRRRRFEVASAPTIAAARALAATRQFDLLISDIGLPDGSGFDLMKELKELYDLRGIALTGYGMEEDITRSQRSGFALHLTKPIQVQLLDRALASLQKETAASG